MVWIELDTNKCSMSEGQEQNSLFSSSRLYIFFAKTRAKSAHLVNLETSMNAQNVKDISAYYIFSLREAQKSYFFSGLAT